MWAQAWSKEKSAMSGNTSLHQWGSFCQKQRSHQEDARIIAKLEFAWWEVTGHKIYSDLVLVHWTNQKAYVKISERPCVPAPQTLRGVGGGSCWLPSSKYFLSVCYILETSGKTRISRMYGLGRLMLYTFSFFNTYFKRILFIYF